MEYAYVCPRGHISQELRTIKHPDGSGEWFCAGCDHCFGVWLDRGELDLGIVPQLPDKFEFTFEEFSETIEEPVDVGLGEVVEQEP
jgi:Zn-finger nucleic acid-binding protein